MGIDQIEEQMNIDLSRLQRQTLERYLRHCIHFGEEGVAEEVRAAMSAQDEAEHMDLAA
jgi:hypothetical protein